ncbi:MULTISPECIES: TetR/AcrR family transcriptional regulator [unclassified Paenibacillus]|uniref:TetR/AcrR family transcriptional regulator n=1 Tax=unclassified Paenibacillus TaxID=185978 RepID=UPI00210C4565|nr:MULTISPECIES: TetR/AcrR family transcriptional regulator [unclassified Paenibacillus]
MGAFFVLHMLPIQVRSCVDFLNDIVQILLVYNICIIIFIDVIVQMEVDIIPKVIVTEEQWIQKGIEQFAQSGADGLVIEKMSADLGCSKSSFYWYFKNRHEFITRLVQRWAELSTNQVIQTSSVHEKPEDQITDLLTQMFSATRKGDFLFYLRKASKDSPAFHTILETIEQARMKYAEELFTKAGMNPEAAAHKSTLLYHYYLGWYERSKYEPVGEEEVNRHIDMLWVQLLGFKGGVR